MQKDDANRDLACAPDPEAFLQRLSQFRDAVEMVGAHVDLLAVSHGARAHVEHDERKLDDLHRVARDAARGALADVVARRLKVDADDRVAAEHFDRVNEGQAVEAGREAAPTPAAAPEMMTPTIAERIGSDPGAVPNSG